MGKSYLRLSRVLVNVHEISVSSKVTDSNASVSSEVQSTSEVCSNSSVTSLLVSRYVIGHVITRSRGYYKLCGGIVDVAVQSTFILLIVYGCSAFFLHIDSLF